MEVEVEVEVEMEVEVVAVAAITCAASSSSRNSPSSHCASPPEPAGTPPAASPPRGRGERRLTRRQLRRRRLPRERRPLRVELRAPPLGRRPLLSLRHAITVGGIERRVRLFQFLGGEALPNQLVLVGTDAGDLLLGVVDHRRREAVERRVDGPTGSGAKGFDRGASRAACLVHGVGGAHPLPCGEDAAAEEERLDGVDVLHDIRCRSCSLMKATRAERVNRGSLHSRCPRARTTPPCRARARRRRRGAACEARRRGVRCGACAPVLVRDASHRTTPTRRARPRSARGVGGGRGSGSRGAATPAPGPRAAGGGGTRTAPEVRGGG